MSRSVSPRPHIAAMVVFAALALAAVVVTPAGAKSGERSTTTVWSQSSGHGSSHSHSYSVAMDDSEAGPDDVQAYVFTRDNGHWNNGSGDEEDW